MAHSTSDARVFFSGIRLSETRIETGAASRCSTHGWGLRMMTDNVLSAPTAITNGPAKVSLQPNSILVRIIKFSRKTLQHRASY